MSQAKWLNKNWNQKKSKKQERRIAKNLSGRTQAGSGCLWKNKGDVRTLIRLIEAKRTDKNSIVLHKEWFEKIRKEAIFDNRVPVLVLEIGKKSYYIMESCYFKE